MMMTLKKGDKIIPIRLPAIDGTDFDSAALNGKRYLLSFFRFATCPFCNLRLHRLIEARDSFGPDFKIVTIFESPLGHLQKYAGRQRAPFPILADPQWEYYRKYGIRHSLGGMFKGMLMRFPTLMKGMFAGYIPLPVRGSLLTMPADFLIDENGTVQTAYYASDEGDHLALETIREFALDKQNPTEKPGTVN